MYAYTSRNVSVALIKNALQTNRSLAEEPCINPLYLFILPLTRSLRRRFHARIVFAGHKPAKPTIATPHQ